MAVVEVAEQLAAFLFRGLSLLDRSFLLLLNHWGLLFLVYRRDFRLLRRRLLRRRLAELNYHRRFHALLVDFSLNRSPSLTGLVYLVAIVDPALLLLSGSALKALGDLALLRKLLRAFLLLKAGLRLQYLQVFFVTLKVRVGGYTHESHNSNDRQHRTIHCFVSSKRG